MLGFHTFDNIRGNFQRVMYNSPDYVYAVHYNLAKWDL